MHGGLGISFRCGGSIFYCRHLLVYIGLIVPDYNVNTSAAEGTFMTTASTPLNCGLKACLYVEDQLEHLEKIAKMASKCFGFQAEISQLLNLMIDVELAMKPLMHPAQFGFQAEVSQLLDLIVDLELDTKPPTRPAHFGFQAEISQLLDLIIDLPTNLPMHPTHFGVQLLNLIDLELPTRPLTHPTYLGFQAEISQLLDLIIDLELPTKPLMHPDAAVDFQLPFHCLNKICYPLLDPGRLKSELYTYVTPERLNGYLLIHLRGLLVSLYVASKKTLELNPNKMNTLQASSMSSCIASKKTFKLNLNKVQGLQDSLMSSYMVSKKILELNPNKASCQCNADMCATCMNKYAPPVSGILSWISPLSRCMFQHYCYFLCCVCSWF